MEKNLEKYEDVENCPVRNILDRFGDKWSILVLLVLSDQEVLRFNQIHKCIVTISQKMLSTTLKSLEADGLIDRKVYAEVPPRVEYKLSERGQSLIPHLQALVEWAEQHYGNIKVSREAYQKKSA